MTIITVNTEPHETDKEELSYEEIFDLAYPSRAGTRPVPVLTCTYFARIGRESVGGSVSPGQTMPVRPNTRVTILHTGNA